MPAWDQVQDGNGVVWPLGAFSNGGILMADGGQVLTGNMWTGAQMDAFGRLRVSTPTTLGESAHQYDASPFYWETVQTAVGTGAHVANQSSIKMEVTNSGDKVVRQSRAYHRYQPGKSLLVMCTFVMGAAQTNLRKRIGYFDGHTSGGSLFANLEGAVVSKSMLSYAGSATGMGLAPGGRMRQEIYDDPHALTDWDQDHTGRGFVHLANSLVWRQITGEQHPTVPPTAREYAKAGLPWFEYYAAGLSAVEGSGILEQLKSFMQFGKHKGDMPLPENEPVHPTPIVKLRRGLAKGQVREGRF